MKLEIILVSLPSALSILLYLPSMCSSLSLKVVLEGVEVAAGIEEVFLLVIGEPCKDSLGEMSIGDVTCGEVGLASELDKCCSMADRRASWAAISALRCS